MCMLLGETGFSSPVLIYFRINDIGIIDWEQTYPGNSNSNNEAKAIALDNNCNFYVNARVRTNYYTHYELLKFSIKPDAGFTHIYNLSTYYYTDTSNYADSWLWDFGDSTFSTQQSPTHTYLMSGIYDVCLWVSNGCIEDSMCKQINIICAPPISNFNYATNYLTVNFTDLSINPSNYFWDFGDGDTSNLKNPTHTYPANGIYTVKLRTLNNCGLDSVIQTIHITGNPIANFSYTTNLLNASFHDSSLYSSSQIWLFGDGNMDTVPNPIHSYLQEGTYQVKLICVNSYGTDTLIDSVTVYSTNISAVKDKNQRHLFPNPTNAKVTLEFESMLASKSVWLIQDLKGNTIKSGIFKKKCLKKHINVANLSNGIYNQNQIITKKIVITK